MIDEHKRELYREYLMFLVRFGGKSGQFGRARIGKPKASLICRNQNELDMSTKRTKKARLDIYRTHIWPTDHDNYGKGILAQCEFVYRVLGNIGRRTSQYRTERSEQKRRR